ncbi:ras-like protein [Anaeramoeba flamelloides]|uniref:Ras-like protein n=1 Tax=Anaeramoeba flamelloides TaxID=1746091 RepID=A0ABQ8XWH0_9EUKA|nr:ras-like protein [Anaeramoeba flamelloides]
MEEHKIVMVGNGGVGKSAMTVRFVQDVFVTEYDPTIEDYYHKVITIDEKECGVEVLDTPSHLEFSSMWDCIYRSGDGFLIVYSITDRSSFEQVTNYYDKIILRKDVNDGEVPIIIVGNKCDLEIEREVSYQEGHDLAQRILCKFIETSALTKQNLEEVFYAIARETKNLKRYYFKSENLQRYKKKKSNFQEEPCIIF